MPRACAPAAARGQRARSGTSGPARCRGAREPARRLLHTAVLGEPPRELLCRLLGLELPELGGLVREQASRLELEQRGDEHEELPACLQVELVPLRHALDEREHDRGDVDVARLELLSEQERQEEVERSLERVEFQLQLADGSRQHGRRLAAQPDATSRAPGYRPRGTAIVSTFCDGPLAPRLQLRCQ